MNENELILILVLIIWSLVKMLNNHLYSFQRRFLREWGVLSRIGPFISRDHSIVRQLGADGKCQS